MAGRYGFGGAKMGRNTMSKNALRRLTGDDEKNFRGVEKSASAWQSRDIGTEGAAMTGHAKEGTRTHRPNRLAIRETDSMRGVPMIPIDFKGKVALVTGVGDSDSFAWYIAKTLQSAGAKIVLACHPRVMGIVDSFLTRDADRADRELPYTGGEFKVEKLFPCDASYDKMDDVPAEVKADRRYAKLNADYSIDGMVNAVGKEFGGIDILIHSMAFSREITKSAKDTSRKAYMEALGISAYSYTSLLRSAEKYMEGRPGGASAVGLTYLGGDRVVPYYGGGMSTAKAALQIDAAQLASNLGAKNIRVNLISAGPYASRAARSIRPGEMEKSIAYAASRSPLPRAITPQEVADATAYLCSPLASAITGHILYVDCGYNVMGV